MCMSHDIRAISTAGFLQYNDCMGRIAYVLLFYCLFLVLSFSSITNFTAYQLPVLWFGGAAALILFRSIPWTIRIISSLLVSCVFYVILILLPLQFEVSVFIVLPFFTELLLLPAFMDLLSSKTEGRRGLFFSIGISLFSGELIFTLMLALVGLIPFNFISLLGTYSASVLGGITLSMLLILEKKHEEVSDRELFNFHGLDIVGTILVLILNIPLMFSGELWQGLLIPFMILILLAGIRLRPSGYALFAPISLWLFLTILHWVSEVSEVHLLYIRMSLMAFYTIGFLITILLSEQAKTNKELKASVLERNESIREMHYQVKSNLQIISSLVNMERFQGGLSDQARRVLKGLQGRIRSIAAIHEKLFQNPNEREVDLSDTARQVIRSLLQSYQCTDRVIPVYDFQGIYLSQDLAQPISLILFELIQNSIEHGMHGKGKIYLTSRLVKEEIHILYRDSGETESSQWKEGKGLGLVKDLLLALEGSLIFEEGAALHLIIPKKRIIHHS
jgi:two-component sensor histidine kinase